MEKDTDAAIEELQRLSCRSDLSLLFYVCLYFIQKKSTEPNKEEIDSSMEKINSLIPTSNNFCLHSSAYIAWSFGDYAFTQSFLDVIKDNDISCSLKGWLALSKRQFKTAKDYFDKILSNHLKSTDILSLYGKAITLAELGDYSNSTQLYAKILSHYDFPEIYIEKARIYIAMNRLSLATETVKTNSNGLVSMFEVHLIELINSLVIESDIVSAEELLNLVIDDLVKYESRNWKLYLEVGKCIITLCHQTNEIVEKVISVIEIASKVSDQVLPFLAYCHMMKHDYLTATDTLSLVQNDDIYSIEARLNILFETSRIAEAADQLDLYKDTINEIIQLKTVEVKIYRTLTGCTGRNVFDLCKILENHIKTTSFKYIRQQPKGEVEFHDFGISLSVISEMFETQFAPMETIYERYITMFGEMRLDSVVSALDEIILQNKSIIYSPDGAFGEKIEEIFTLLFKLIPNVAPLRLSYAIFLQMNKKHADSLNVIQNYLIQRWPFRLPLCFLTAAINEACLNNMEQTVKYLESAQKIAPILVTFLDFIILKCKIEKDLCYLPENTENLPLSALLQIIDLTIECNDFEKGHKYFRAATVLAKSPKEKAFLVIRQAKLLASKKQFSRAFDILKKLKHHKKYRSEAVCTEAYIYLHFLGDDDKYMLCYEQLCEYEPTAENFLFAGDAFYDICEFDSAAVFYQESFQLNYDSSVLQKMVSSLIKSHQFNTAISKYRMIGCTPLFLIKTLYKLKHLQKAKQFLEHSIRLIRPSQQLIIAPYIELRGDVHSDLSENAEAIEDYKAALQIYNAVFDQALPNVFIDDIKCRASIIARKIGDLTPMKEKVLDDYYLSLKFDPSNVDAFVAIFNFYKMRNDLASCHKLCLDFLANSSSSETVALLLTTIETRDFTKSINSLECVLDAHPRFHRALVRLIEICARAGKLSIAKNRLKKYNNDTSYGISFCKGLLNLYTGNMSEALTHFTVASANRRWELSAKLCMFNLYINPDRKYIWCESNPLTSQSNLQKASDLLGTLQLEESDTMILTAELFSAYNDEKGVRRALELFTQVLDTQQNSVPALVGIAKCNIRLGNAQVANSYIDKVLLYKPFHETFAYFEECYLMRASIISAEKDFRASQHFIFLAIDLNLSSKKGWEMSGIVHKQNKMYLESAIAYSKCWDLGDRKDQNIGFNYAYCSLMANRPDEALVICRKLLDDNPGFTEILEKVMIPAFKKLKM